jgi:transposase IS66 family protein
MRVLERLSRRRSGGGVRGEKNMIRSRSLFVSRELASRHFEAGQKLDIDLLASSGALADAGSLLGCARFLDDGRLCTSNNAAERELRAVAVGRRNWTFAGSDEGGRRAAAI